MFNEFYDEIKLKNEQKISAERREAEKAAVFARISGENEAACLKAGEPAREKENAPRIIRAEKTPVLKMIIPAAALAAAVAVALPFGVDFLRKRADISASAGKTSSDAENSQSAVISTVPGENDTSDFLEAMQKYDEQKEKYGKLLPDDYSDIPSEMTFGVITEMRDHLMVSHIKYFDEKNGRSDIYTDKDGNKVLTLDFLFTSDAEIVFDDGAPASESDLAPKTAVMVEYSSRNDAYPGQMYCKKIVICREKAQPAPLTADNARQIGKIFSTWAYLDCELHPSYYADRGLCKHKAKDIDETQSFTEEIPISGTAYTDHKTFYKVTGVEYAFEEGFNRLLSEIFTDRMTKFYLSGRSDVEYRFKDGETYVNATGHTDDFVPAGDLDVFLEQKDEKTVNVKLSFDRGGEKDVRTAQLVLGENGEYRIDSAVISSDDRFTPAEIFHLYACNGKIANVYEGDVLLLQVKLK